MFGGEKVKNIEPSHFFGSLQNGRKKGKDTANSAEDMEALFQVISLKKDKAGD